MFIEIDSVEFEAEGKATPEQGDLMTDVPGFVTDRLASELGDIEVKSFDVWVDEESEELMYRWRVYGRRDPLDL